MEIPQAAARRGEPYVRRRALPCREMPEGSDPRHEKIRSPAHPHERFERRDAPARRLPGELEFAAARRQNRVGTVVLVREFRVLDPRLLAELELPPDVRVEAKKVEAARSGRRRRDGVELRQKERWIERRRDGLAVRATATHEAMLVD